MMEGLENLGPDKGFRKLCQDSRTDISFSKYQLKRFRASKGFKVNIEEMLEVSTADCGQAGKRAEDNKIDKDRDYHGGEVFLAKIDLNVMNFNT